MKTIRGIITVSTDHLCANASALYDYVERDQEVYAVHRVDNGAGTFLFSAYDRKNTRYISMEAFNNE